MCQFKIRKQKAAELLFEPRTEFGGQQLFLECVCSLLQKGLLLIAVRAFCFVVRVTRVDAVADTAQRHIGFEITFQRFEFLVEIQLLRGG